MGADETPVGRTGTTSDEEVVDSPVEAIELEEAVDVVEPGGRGHSEEVPHTRSVGQHPPPKLAGQDWKLAEQEVLEMLEELRELVEPVVVVDVVVVVVEIGLVVLSTTVVIVEETEGSTVNTRVIVEVIIKLGSITPAKV